MFATTTGKLVAGADRSVRSRRFRAGVWARGRRTLVGLTAGGGSGSIDSAGRTGVSADTPGGTAGGVPGAVTATPAPGTADCGVPAGFTVG